jgi:hypothetical protein
LVLTLDGIQQLALKPQKVYWVRAKATGKIEGWPETSHIWRGQTWINEGKEGIDLKVYSDKIHTF